MPHPATGRAVAIALAAFAAASVSAQSMYKWVDEKGVTHYSESPPPEDAKTKTKATKIEPKVIPPSSPSAYKDNEEKWKGQEREFKKRQIERGQAEKSDARNKAERAQACNEARERQTTLTSSMRIFRDNPDGTRTYMSDEARAANLARAREQIKEYCD